MRLGLIARADNTGLGNQTWEFYRHMNPAKTMVVDIGSLNGNKSYQERYPGAQYVYGFPNKGDINDFLQDLDVVFVAESPYNYWLYERAKELGVKVAVQYNYEFFDWFANPHYPMPDMLIAPSKWHYEDVDQFARASNMVHTYLHCPVNRELLPFREIKAARTFLHMAGKPAAHDRNGTYAVIEATKYLKTDAKIVIHFQGEQGLKHQLTDTTADYIAAAAGTGVEIIVKEFENYPEVYKLGDVLVLPRRYGGNCLPMNEALSCGMPVIMPEIVPNRQLLPKNWTIPALKTAEFKPRTTIDIYSVDPKHLAGKIDEFYLKNTSQMRFENIMADKIAQKISWLAMKPEYERELEKLCNR